jgi:hypothetical protein
LDADQDVNAMPCYDSEMAAGAFCRLSETTSIAAITIAKICQIEHGGRGLDQRGEVRQLSAACYYYPLMDRDYLSAVLPFVAAQG